MSDTFIAECVDCGYSEETDSKRKVQKLVKEHREPGHRTHWKKEEWALE